MASVASTVLSARWRAARSIMSASHLFVFDFDLNYLNYLI